MKSMFLDRRVRFNVTAFYNTYENQQISVGRIIDNQTVVAILNAQEATLMGLEADFIFVFGNGWSVAGSYGYVHGEYDEFTVVDVEFGPPPQLEETVVVRDISDTKVIRGSPYTYSIGITKQFNFDRGDSLIATLGWSFRGRRYDDLEAPAHSYQPKYGLADARFVWTMANGRTAVSLWANNLFDREYSLSRGGGPDTIIQRQYWSQGRRFGVELTHNFAN